MSSAKELPVICTNGGATPKNAQFACKSGNHHLFLVPVLLATLLQTEMKQVQLFPSQHLHTRETLSPSFAAYHAAVSSTEAMAEKDHGTSVSLNGYL